MLKQARLKRESRLSLCKLDYPNKGIQGGQALRRPYLSNYHPVQSNHKQQGCQPRSQGFSPTSPWEQGCMGQRASSETQGKSVGSRMTSRWRMERRQPCVIDSCPTACGRLTIMDNLHGKTLIQSSHLLLTSSSPANQPK